MGKSAYKKDVESAKPLVHLLVCLFGITSWSIMNGLWVELPILVSHLPEGWTLPSYLTIIAQFGNLGPLVFAFLSWLFPRTKLETPVSMLVLSVLSLCALFYAFFWDKTIDVAGQSFSVALLSLTLCQSIFAATSSMSYLGFMAHLKSRYMASIFIGQGLSGLIPAFIAIGQGTGEIRCVPNVTNVTEGLRVEALNLSHSASLINSQPPNNTSVVDLVRINLEANFSVRVFFLILFVFGIVSLTSLLLLVYHPYCHTEHVDTEKEENCQLMLASSPDKEATPNSNDLTLSVETGHRKSQAATTSTTSSGLEPSKPSRIRRWLAAGRKKEGGSQIRRAEEDRSEKNEDLFSNSRENHQVSKETHLTPKHDSQGRQLSKLESWYLLGLLVWINSLQTSYVLAIQVYSSLPYGLNIYDGVTKAENIVDPIACFVTLFFTAKTTRVISGLTLLGTLFTAYIITVAAMSPLPFLVDETIGGILVITAWVMCTLFMVFSKVSIAGVMRSQGRKSLIFTGGATQIGSLIGAILAYCMINPLNLFQDGPWC